jgi:hypothetical protein
MRPLLVEASDEVIEARLLLQDIRGGWLRRFLLQRQMHVRVARGGGNGSGKRSRRRRACCAEASCLRPSNPIRCSCLTVAGENEPGRLPIHHQRSGGRFWKNSDGSDPRHLGQFSQRCHPKPRGSSLRSPMPRAATRRLFQFALTKRSSTRSGSATLSRRPEAVSPSIPAHAPSWLSTHWIDHHRDRR